MTTEQDTIVVAREEETTTPSTITDFEHIPFGTQVYSESDPLGVQALKDVESTVEELEGTIQTLESSFSQISIPTKITDLDNDGGFVTESSLSGFLTPEDLDGFVKESSLSGFLTEDDLEGFVKESSLSDLVSKTDLADGIEFGDMNVTDLTINGNRPIAIPNDTLDTAIGSITAATDVAEIKDALVTLFTAMKNN